MSEESDLKRKVGETLERVFPGQVQRDVSLGAGGAGHNSGAADDRLRLLIERVERLEEEKQGIADDIRDVYAEAKAVGYDAKIMRQIVRLRKMKPDDRREMEAILETYKAALGMDYVSTPLGDATVRRAAENLRDTVRSAGATMTIRTDDSEVTIS